MNWKKSLFKPKWQHKNPAIRAEAVTHGQEPELLQALFEIATSDEAAEVRTAATRRLRDPLQVLDAISREQDKDILGVLSDRLRGLLLHPDQASGDPETRVAAVGRCEGREMLEAIAAAAPETELRRAALQRCERPGFLGDCAIKDPDPELRRFAASLIQQESTLRRVIEATRTTDKQLHTDLSNRLHRELLARGDSKAVRQEALDICRSLESFLRADQAPRDSEIQALERRWQVLGEKAPDDLAKRFSADLQRLRSLAPGQEPEQDLAGETRAEPEPAPEAVPEQAGEEKTESESKGIHAGLVEAWRSIEAALGKKRPLGERKIENLSRNWERASAAAGVLSAAEEELKTRALDAVKKLQESARKAQERREKRVTQATQHLSSMLAALEEGELHNALEQRASLQKLKESLKGTREWKEIQSKISSTHGRLRELRDWHHWANDKIRKRLIKEMEGLPGTGLHPDAVLDRIKALQTEWKSLEASEQIPGDRHYAAAPWMWRKFSAAGKTAFELTKPYLDKRSELRSKNLEDVRHTARELNDLCAQEAVDMRLLSRQIGRVRKSLRSLDSIPARERQKTAEALKQALGRANDVKQAHYADIEKQKLKLVREASQLQHIADREEAIAQAKSLQAQWKAAGSLWRSRENELWQEFREPINPLFADLEAERESVRMEQAERLIAQEQLCTQLESLLEAEDEQLAEQHGRVQGLVDDWLRFRKPVPRFKARFDKAHASFKEREAKILHAAVREQKARWWGKAELLHQAEAASATGKLTKAQMTGLKTQWDKLTGDNHSLDQSLDARFGQLRVSDDSIVGGGDDQLESARRICICLEFLAGIPSPEDEKELRMKYQVERLSASMTGERERVPAVEEARQLEKDWLLHPFVPDPDYDALQQRVRQALSQVLEE